MEISIPQWMTTEFLQKCLGEDIRYKDIVIKRFSATSAVPPGNNYGGVLIRVMIEYKINNQEENLSIIVKFPISEGALKELTDNVTDPEPMFYKKIIPEAYKKLNYNFVPKAFNSPIDTVVVMEDLKLQGYVMGDRFKQLDFHHCMLYTKAAASFHAVSSVIYKENPDMINSICTENVYTNESSVGRFIKSLGLWGVECMAKHTSDQRIKKILIDCLDKLWDMLIELHKPNQKFVCVIQGDPWTTNMMFKYDNAENVVDIKLIDFQMVSVNTPIHDLIAFIWCCANCDVREQKLLDLYTHYHKRLNEHLQVLNSAQIDFDDFMASVKRFSPLALFTAAMLPLTINPNPIDLNFMITESSNEGKRSRDNPLESYYTESYCTTELPLMIRHLEAAGVFEYLESNQL